MKKQFLTIVIFLLFQYCNAQLQFSNGDENYISGFVDPTFTDKGFQFGLTYTMKSDIVFAEYSISYYNALEPSYTDFTVTYGLALEIGKLDILTGARLGFIWREQDDFAFLTGGSMRLQYPVTDNIYIGVQGWIDMRTDIGNDFIRENGALYLSYKLN